jgi:LacI family repressor for deo operon, udp, cdd, tsx, nupC, and nupG
MPTISDVAREANVSVATISRVLNKNPRVLPETRTRVLEAIERLHYEPNVLARNFRRSESRVILVLCPNFTNPYYANVVTGIADEARHHGYSAMFCTTAGDKLREKEFLDMLKGKRADGAILLATENTEKFIVHLAEQHPIVQCSEYFPDSGLCHVSIDNYKAARHSIRYLTGLGHKRIGFITSNDAYLSMNRRYQGYRDELERAGIPFDPELVQYSGEGYHFSNGLKAANNLLALPVKPTAVLCVSDILALGAVRAAEDAGIRIPEELSIIGFDDVEYATMFKPHITTVRIPCYDLGRTSMDLLRNLMTGMKAVRREVYLDFELVVRDST